MGSKEKRVTTNELAAAVAEALEEYGDTLGEEIAADVDEVAAATVRDLRQTSPKRTGAYRKGWTKKQLRKTKGKYVVLAYNKGKPHLTHLLEYGHKKRGGGMVAARPHVDAAAQKAKNTLLAKIKSHC